MHVGYGADELGEDLLDLFGGKGALLEEVVVELIACLSNQICHVFPNIASYQGSTRELARPGTL